MDKLTKNFIKLEGVLVVILGLLVLWALCSCTKTEYITVERVRNDTVWQNHTKHDSIWVHDSIHVTDKGDTVRIEKWHTKYVEKKLSWFQKTLIGVGILSIMALVIFIAFKLKRFLP